jgi:hypothetical protein
MKVRMLAVIAIFSLAAWLPVPAQQPVTPAAPAQQTPAPAGDSRKATTKHECSKGSENVNCCHGKDTEGVKADCCQGKSAKEMPSSTKSDKGDQATVPCCIGMKEGPSTAKAGKSCCGGAEKDCGSKMATQCPAQANGK